MKVDTFLVSEWCPGLCPDDNQFVIAITIDIHNAGILRYKELPYRSSEGMGHDDIAISPVEDPESYLAQVRPGLGRTLGGRCPGTEQDVFLAPYLRDADTFTHIRQRVERRKFGWWSKCRADNAFTGISCGRDATSATSGRLQQ